MLWVGICTTKICIERDPLKLLWKLYRRTEKNDGQAMGFTNLRVRYGYEGVAVLAETFWSGRRPVGCDMIFVLQKAV